MYRDIPLMLEQHVRIPEGSYELKDLNDEIIQQMQMKKHYHELTNKPYISITANLNTLRTELETLDNYTVDFRIPNSLNRILEFKRKVYHAGVNTSEHIVDILPVDSIFISLDLINGSYVNGTKKSVIYSFIPNVEPGFKIVETPPYLVSGSLGYPNIAYTSLCFIIVCFKCLFMCTLMCE
jgi:hypothetical protein